MESQVIAYNLAALIVVGYLVIAMCSGRLFFNILEPGTSPGGTAVPLALLGAIFWPIVWVISGCWFLSCKLVRRQ